ncbi:DUF2911 domain-containing protein [Robertkochia solimangrovi]|uniref:DUF2911 domain-containing protein n=1 Tax=Robertkochia solimangrovi TaxID=2213046 RepID=UPI00117C2634|nr:DUF2911 domain-containing protein [Robertkochia solimangrovi]TRZ42730.1 DUF2911 domain-containing protein [Robertkochia solimangrovi]
MSKKLIAGITLILAVIFSSEIQAQNFSGIDKSPADIVYYRIERSSPPLIKVVYGRPMLKGRSVGKDLAPFGEVWRTGANEATEIRFYQNVSIGGKAVPAGTYSLFTIPGEKEWTIIINKDLDVWGAFSYNEANDVLRFNVPSGSGDKSLEAFSIAFEPAENGANMLLGWDKLRVAVPITIL